jgi:predicted nuclease of predicted toxin-antitoxin system
VKFLFDHDVPDDLASVLQASGHEVRLLRTVLPVTTPDEDILRFACEHGEVLITCNRDDFLKAANHIRHAGLIVLIRRRSRALECASLIRLLDRAGEAGVCHNINFA